jgi:hypothetical protein
MRVESRGEAVSPGGVRRLRRVLLAIALLGSAASCGSGGGPGAGDALPDPAAQAAAATPASAATGEGAVQFADPDSPAAALSLGLRRGGVRIHVPLEARPPERGDLPAHDGTPRAYRRWEVL